jgi:pyruvate dehydrogenase E2 component (dihydrolipoamide acetyltransferase)
VGRAVERRLAGADVRAKPPVRRLARELGVDLDQVVPTGPGGTITHQDVERSAASVDSEVLPMSHVTRMMAQAARAAAQAPQATEWVDVDVTATGSLVRAARAHPRFAGLTVSTLTVAALGLVRAAQSHPRINATVDEAAETLILHRGVHLGVAVASPRGLLVPVVREAHELDLRGIAEALTRVVEAARAGRATPSDLTGSSITLTNIGSLGVDGGTPLLNAGQVAILALGRVLPRPWVVAGRVEVREVATLSLTFDHRAIDGALAARALGDVAQFLKDPAPALALG